MASNIGIASMKFILDKQDRYTIFKPEEENLNSLVAPKLKSEFVILANEGIKNLILDLNSVRYIDSSGLSSILTARRLWTQLGSFVVTGVEHSAVKRLVEISKVDSVLTILPTVSESVDYVFMEDLQRDLQAEVDEEVGDGE
ncbi:MAG: STAS domain-containing protein [Bacteroidota bacterium]